MAADPLPSLAIIPALVFSAVFMTIQHSSFYMHLFCDSPCLLRAPPPRQEKVRNKKCELQNASIFITIIFSGQSRS